MAILDESKYQQPRDKATSGPVRGVNAGLASAGSAVANVGANVASRTAAPAPSGGGGGGAAPAAAAPSDGIDWGALAAMSSAGLSPQDILALGSGGGQTAAPQQQQTGGVGMDNTLSFAPVQASAPASGQEALPIDTDPALLALYAQYDQDLANTESGYRRQQDELRRNLADGMPDVARQFDLGRIGIKNAYEGRGLLKSGAAETAVGNSYEDQGRQTANMERQATDQIANLEQEIAQARVNNAIARSNAARSAAGSASQGVIGSVA